MGVIVVWSGRGALNRWPETDKVVPGQFLGDETEYVDRSSLPKHCVNCSEEWGTVQLGSCSSDLAVHNRRRDDLLCPKCVDLGFTVKPYKTGQSYRVIPPSTTKACTRCKTKKRFQDFFKNPKGSFGLQSWCKACQRAYNATYCRTSRARRKAS